MCNLLWYLDNVNIETRKGHLDHDLAVDGAPPLVFVEKIVKVSNA